MGYRIPITDYRILNTEGTARQGAVKGDRDPWYQRAEAGRDAGGGEVL